MQLAIDHQSADAQDVDNIFHQRGVRISGRTPRTAQTCHPSRKIPAAARGQHHLHLLLTARFANHRLDLLPHLPSAPMSEASACSWAEVGRIMPNIGADPGTSAGELAGRSGAECGRNRATPGPNSPGVGRCRSSSLQAWSAHGWKRGLRWLAACGSRRGGSEERPEADRLRAKRRREASSAHDTPNSRQICASQWPRPGSGRCRAACFHTSRDEDLRPKSDEIGWMGPGSRKNRPASIGLHPQNFNWRRSGTIPDPRNAMLSRSHAAQTRGRVGRSGEDEWGAG